MNIVDHIPNCKEDRKTWLINKNKLDLGICNTIEFNLINTNHCLIMYRVMRETVLNCHVNILLQIRIALLKHILILMEQIELCGSF